MNTRELLLSAWRIDPLALVACGGAVVAYVMWERQKSGARSIAFASAIVLVVLALASPIGVLSDGYLFSAHMLKKLLLVLIVPPLALLGMKARENRPENKVVRVLMRPVVAWGLGVGAMWLWHAPTLCDSSASNPIMQRVQEISLLAMGTAFWRPIVGPNVDARLQPLSGVLYLFTACVACTLLGVIVTFSPVAVCSVFLHTIDRLGVMPLIRNGWGLSLEKDQQIGGLFMWVPACLVYGCAILGLIARWYRNEEPSHEPASLAREAS